MSLTNDVYVDSCIFETFTFSGMHDKIPSLWSTINNYFNPLIAVIGEERVVQVKIAIIQDAITETLNKDYKFLVSKYPYLGYELVNLVLRVDFKFRRDASMTDFLKLFSDYLLQICISLLEETKPISNKQGRLLSHVFVILLDERKGNLFQQGSQVEDTYHILRDNPADTQFILREYLKKEVITRDNIVAFCDRIYEEVYLGLRFHRVMSCDNGLFTSIHFLWFEQLYRKLLEK